jgi:hypothetical protein
MAIRHPSLFTGLVILFEVLVGISVLANSSTRRIGYVAALVFFLVLAPLIGWYGLANLVWAVPTLMLLRYDRRVSAGSAA